MAGLTLYEKLWRNHIVSEQADGVSLLYIDRLLLYEVTSPQAFESLQLTGRSVWRPSASLATCDHNVPTLDRERGIADPLSRAQVDALDANCRKFNIPQFRMSDVRQGIVHVIGPEQGATLPGMTVVCGDSHTSTHGALGTLAFGVGTSDVEHVLATQCLAVGPMQPIAINVTGSLQSNVVAKDVIQGIIRKIGSAGGSGCAVEFRGPVIRDLSIEARMTLCNMVIEAGARVGLVGVDEKTINYVRGKPLAPTGSNLEVAERFWRTLVSDPDAEFTRTINIDVSDLKPMVSWGTTSDMVVAIDECIPSPEEEPDQLRRASMHRALQYMGLVGGRPVTSISIDAAFIGSCTNGRIEDFRSAAQILRGRHISPTVRRALAVPGSGLVKAQAEAEGLDAVFRSAGFEWRDPGCSMCLGMNADQLRPEERCASTSNRNFEGRQGYGGRTHLVSPAMAAAAAVAGHFINTSDI